MPVRDSHSALQPVVLMVRRTTAYLSEDFLGGPRLLKLAWVVNFQKGLTWAWVAGLMAAYGNTSTVAWVYLALHGSYGLCWLMKDAAFPDPRWQTRLTAGGGLMAFLLVLGPYWLFPWLLVSGVLGARPEPPPELLAGAIALHTVGVALMLSADSQKYFTLRYRPGLIEEGLWARTRHPNYLGEMAILFGDRNIVGGTVTPFGFRVAPTNTISWTSTIHTNCGNFVLVDGSLLVVRHDGLRKQLADVFAETRRAELRFAVPRIPGENGMTDSMLSRMLPYIGACAGLLVLVVA